MANPKRHPLDGYDFVADVPRGTPLLVQSPDGKIWRLSKRGVRYHEDVPTALHGAAPARPPATIAASARIREILKRTLDVDNIGQLPTDAGEPIARWVDAPQFAGSLAQPDELTVYANGWVRARRPVYDDCPRIGAQQVSDSVQRQLSRDLAIAPRGSRLPCVTVRARARKVAE